MIWIPAYSLKYLALLFYNFYSCSFIKKIMLFIRISTRKNLLIIYQSIFEVHLFLFPSKIRGFWTLLGLMIILFWIINIFLFLTTYQYAFFCVYFYVKSSSYSRKMKWFIISKLSRQFFIGWGVLGKALIYSFVFLLL